jgi:hypothetical protein
MTEREDLDRVAERLAERLAAPSVGPIDPHGDEGPVVVAEVAGAGDAALTESSPAAPAEAAEPDRVVHDAAVVSIAGQHVSVADSAVVAVAAGTMEADDSLIVVGAIGSLGGNARVLFDVPSALAFGAAFGAVFALLVRLLGGRRG